MNARAAADARGPPLEEDGAGGNLRDQSASIQAIIERIQEVVQRVAMQADDEIAISKKLLAEIAMSKKVLAVWVVVAVCLSVGFCHQQTQIRSLQIEAAARTRQVEMAVTKDQNLVVLSIIFLLIAILAAAVKFKSP